MPIKYRGSGDTSDVNLYLYGDGTSASAKINLCEAPFQVKFKGRLPSIAYLVKEQSSTPGTYPDIIEVSVISGGVLKVKFESPLPAVTLSQPDEVGGPSEGINLAIRFIYG